MLDSKKFFAAELFAKYIPNKTKIISMETEVANYVELLKNISCDDFVLCSRSLIEIGFSATRNVSSLVEMAVLNKERQESEIKNKILQIESKIGILQREICAVDRVMSLLTYRQRMLIELKFFNRMTWSDIVQQYADKYGFACERTLRSYLHQIYSLLEV